MPKKETERGFGSVLPEKAAGPGTGSSDIAHSILIVSPSAKFDAIVRRSLKGFIMTDSRKSAAMARRCILERYYDLVVIDVPLPDEPGEQLAMDITETCSASVLLVVPAEIYDGILDQVTDQGILVVSKPFPHGRLDHAVRFLVSIQNRMRRLEKKLEAAQEKMEELRIVNKAKFLLVEQKQMTEDEAHRFIGKQAMNNGVSRRRIAEQLLEDL